MSRCVSTGITPNNVQALLQTTCVRTCHAPPTSCLRCISAFREFMKNICVWLPSRLFIKTNEPFNSWLFSNTIGHRHAARTWRSRAHMIQEKCKISKSHPSVHVFDYRMALARNGKPIMQRQHDSLKQTLQKTMRV